MVEIPEFDITIIGAGCVGSAIAQRLAKHDISIALVEKEEDVSMGATKANSGIIHAAYFTPKNSMKEQMNLRGNQLFDLICPQIGVEFKRVGAVFCAFSKDDVDILKEEYKIDQQRKIPCELIEDKAVIKYMEPNIGDNVIALLHFPTAGIIIPFELTVGLAEHAVLNGTKLFLEYEVSSITQNSKGFTIAANDGRKIQTRTIINAAGVFSDKIAEMVGLQDFKIIPRRGEYVLFDKNAISLNKVLFPTPTMESKGILVSPTLHKNIFIGPNAHAVDSREMHNTTTAGINEIIAGAKKMVPNLPMRLAITNFAGVRATSSTHDFVIGTTKIPHFLNAAGIESPGLSSCLAIAEKIELILQSETGYHFQGKKNYITGRAKPERFAELSMDQLAQRIKDNPQWGQMVCRCEWVTEAEIVNACHAPIPATNTDMIKRRLRPGMGRCQGGFCLPKIMKIISREQQKRVENVTKTGGTSQIVIGRIKQLPSEIYENQDI